jgi:hypothetical protein
MRWGPPACLRPDYRKNGGEDRRAAAGQQRRKTIMLLNIWKCPAALGSQSPSKYEFGEITKRFDTRDVEA